MASPCVWPSSTLALDLGKQARRRRVQRDAYTLHASFFQPLHHAPCNWRERDRNRDPALAENILHGLHHVLDECRINDCLQTNAAEVSTIIFTHDRILYEIPLKFWPRHPRKHSLVNKAITRLRAKRTVCTAAVF